MPGRGGQEGGKRGASLTAEAMYGFGAHMVPGILWWRLLYQAQAVPQVPPYRHAEPSETQKSKSGRKQSPAATRTIALAAPSQPLLMPATQGTG